MWHKVRKMFMGSSPQSHDRLDDSDNSKDEGALLQRGYLKPLPATSLLNSENRQHLLQQLWENSLLPQAQYEQYFLEPLKSCISLMQRLPATSGGHHAVPGGMVDYSLKIVVFASRLSRGYMLPPGASAEEQSAQSAAWGAVIFYCALFHSLSSLRNIEGELLNGEVWHPGISVPDQPYRFRFRPTVPSGAGEGLRAMLGMRLLPGEVIRWLSKTPHALDSLLSFIRGDVENASVIFQIVKDAIQHAGGNSQEVPDELAVVASGITPVQVSEDTPGAADSLESSSSALKSSTELTSGASLSSAVNVQEQEPLSGSLTSALDESSVAPVVDTGQQEDEKAIREVMSLLGLGTAPAAREEVEQELAPRPECSEIMSGTLSDLVRCPDEGASGVSEVNPPEPSPSVADLNEDTREVNGIKETFKIRPQATAGVSWHNSLFTAAADVDLTPGSSFNGDPHPQFARVGGEFNAWSWAQVRAGYQQSLDHNEGSAFTAGIGISPFDVVHLDLTGLVGTDRTYGAVAQLSVTF